MGEYQPYPAILHPDIIEAVRAYTGPKQPETIERQQLIREAAQRRIAKLLKSPQPTPEQELFQETLAALAILGPTEQLSALEQEIALTSLPQLLEQPLDQTWQIFAAAAHSRLAQTEFATPFVDRTPFLGLWQRMGIQFSLQTPLQRTLRDLEPQPHLTETWLRAQDRVLSTLSQLFAAQMGPVTYIPQLTPRTPDPKDLQHLQQLISPTRLIDTTIKLFAQLYEQPEGGITLLPTDSTERQTKLQKQLYNNLMAILKFAYSQNPEDNTPLETLYRQTQSSELPQSTKDVIIRILADLASTQTPIHELLQERAKAEHIDKDKYTDQLREQALLKLIEIATQDPKLITTLIKAEENAVPREIKSLLGLALLTAAIKSKDKTKISRVIAEIHKLAQSGDYLKQEAFVQLLIIIHEFAPTLLPALLETDSHATQMYKDVVADAGRTTRMQRLESMPTFITQAIEALGTRRPNSQEPIITHPKLAKEVLVWYFKVLRERNNPQEGDNTQEEMTLSPEDGIQIITTLEALGMPIKLRTLTALILLPTIDSEQDTTRLIETISNLITEIKQPDERIIKFIKALSKLYPHIYDNPIATDIVRKQLSKEPASIQNWKLLRIFLILAPQEVTQQLQTNQNLRKLILAPTLSDMLETRFTELTTQEIESKVQRFINILKHLQHIPINMAKLGVQLPSKLSSTLKTIVRTQARRALAHLEEASTQLTTQLDQLQEQYKKLQQEYQNILKQIQKTREEIAEGTTGHAQKQIKSLAKVGITLAEKRATVPQQAVSLQPAVAEGTKPPTTITEQIGEYHALATGTHLTTNQARLLQEPDLLTRFNTVKQMLERLQEQIDTEKARLNALANAKSQLELLTHSTQASPTSST